MSTTYPISIALLETRVKSRLFHVDYEQRGHGDLWRSTVLENDDNPPMEILPQPDPSGINTSATVVKITRLQEGAPFTAYQTMHGAGVGTFSSSQDKAYLTMLVYNSVSTDVGFQCATPEGASIRELQIADTLTDQWERWVFDFTAVIGEAPSHNLHMEFSYLNRGIYFVQLTGQNNTSIKN